MLVHMLRSNPQIVAHGEVFNYGTIGALAGEYGQRRQCSAYEEKLEKLYRSDPKAFLYDIVFETQHRSCAGFKIKTDELFRWRYRYLRKLLARDNEIKVVHLYRKDLISQFVSWKVVNQQTGVTLIHRAEERPKVQPFRASTAAFRLFLRRVFKREALSLKLYQKHRSFVIAYEEAAAASNDVLRNLQVFLGVKPQELEQATVKILTRPATDLLLNFNEIKAIFDDAHAARPMLSLPDR